ncbi:hypothetical protein BC827DRAFT_1272849 [Russula dissimulans]|nr:hypothetical protein BC827DRAFT_1272849 [Russula dissimulans]
MISDFLTSDWGHLQDGDEHICVVFKARKNHNGWFRSEKLLVQVNQAVENAQKGSRTPSRWSLPEVPRSPRTDLLSSSLVLGAESPEEVSSSQSPVDSSSGPLVLSSLGLLVLPAFSSMWESLHHRGIFQGES